MERLLGQDYKNLAQREAFLRDKVIDEQLDIIRGIAPEIAIIEV